MKHEQDKLEELEELQSANNDEQLNMTPSESECWARFRWVKHRYTVRFELDRRLTNFAAGGLVMAGTAAMSLAAAGIPTGFGVWLDQLMFAAANGIGMLLAGILLPVVFSFLYIPLPRRLLSIVVYVAGEAYFILYFSDLGIWPSIILGVVYALLGAVIGLWLGLVMYSRLRVFMKLSIVCLIAAALVSVPWLPGFPGAVKLPARDPSANGEVSSSAAIAVSKTPLDDPSRFGGYEFEKLSYGSGSDKHRRIFGAGADYVSESVDASAYITSWSKLKTAFWGFDEHKLPLNGRVWMPEGEGPFPLVLMVHGNHLMEYFSDGGYGYLGELLASRGMIAVSVDANFFNYSVWSSLPNDDMKMRAWLMLQHLAYLHQLGQQEGSSFAGKIDWQSVALIGHSRGGQAVAMAADAKRWFEEDEVLDKLSDIRIQSVIAIAPTDKRVDDESARLTDINYLTLQGAMDADVNNFYGDRQYNRVTFSGTEKRLKAELYLSNANHSQFNTDWGRMDERLPGGLLLNSEGLMDEEEQRQIAKTYIAAFLEATLHNRSEYEALFQDYRIGAAWLPESTRYVNRYESSELLTVENYEHLSPIVLDDASEGLDAKRETAKDRDGNGRGTDGMLLEWREADASYTVNLKPVAGNRLRPYADGSLAFSLANSEWQLPDIGYLPPLPAIELAAADRSGRVWSVPIEEVAPLQAPAYMSFMRLGFLERTVKDNKYKEPAEAVFQTFIVPISLFQAEDGSGDLLLPENIASITFRFKTAAGRVMVDDIGFMKQGGTYVEYKSSS